MATVISCIIGANIDLEYYQNDEFDKSLSITDADSNPVNLNGKNLLMQIKNYRSDSTALAELTDGAGITVSGTYNNTITFDGDYDIESGTYYYDLRNTDDNKTIIYGLFIVTGDVSK